MTESMSVVILRDRLIAEARGLEEQSRQKWLEAATLEGRIAKDYLDASLWSDAKGKIIDMARMLMSAKVIENNFHSMIIGTMSNNDSNDIQWSYDQMVSVLKEKS